MPQQNFIMRKSFFCESHWCFGINECSALEHSGPSVTVPPPLLSDSQGEIGWNSHFPLTALLYGGNLCSNKPCVKELSKFCPLVYRESLQL